MDPGGVHIRGAGEPPGLGHGRLPLLLHRDLRVGDCVRLRDPLQQSELGCSGLCLSLHGDRLLPQCVRAVGLRDPGLKRTKREHYLQAGHRCSGLLVRGDPALLHPHHPLCLPMEIFLDLSPLLFLYIKLWRADMKGELCATSGSPQLSEAQGLDDG